MYCIPKNSKETSRGIQMLLSKQQKTITSLYCCQNTTYAMKCLKFYERISAVLVAVRHYRKHTYHLIPVPLSIIPSLMGMVCEPNRGWMPSAFWMLCAMVRSTAKTQKTNDANLNSDTFINLRGNNVEKLRFPLGMKTFTASTTWNLMKTAYLRSIPWRKHFRFLSAVSFYQWFYYHDRSRKSI